jgi:hypothetical protein
MFDHNIRLLLACARPVATRVRGEQVRELLRERIDWHLLLEQANWHCVSSLLYSALKTEARDIVPADVFSTLRSRYELNFRHNLFLSGQMMQLVQKLGERDIPVVAYKGPALCSYYGELGLREFGDLDFLVLPGDVARANDILAAEGFRPHLSNPCVQEPRTLPFARTFHYEMAYTTADSSTKVDLHWALMPGFWALPSQVEQVWDRLQVLPVAGGSVRTLSHEDSLLLLCAHGAKHMWRSLGWICDVAALLHTVPELDWNAILARAGKLRVKRALGLGLDLANNLLGASVPADVLHESDRDKEAHKLGVAVRNELFAGDRESESVLATCAFLMRTRENARDAVRCALERIFQPTIAEWQSVPLPRMLFPAYYLLRPARLLMKHGFRS